MENLEEVLQALDEFQKMRPTEIPRELEDYLCWVAKTGDPVYQWSLIKTLFREKLTRVMTDFYESCPTLELAPCPNVEHFNYDTMKSNLLERLESFANAPFTVQRICELLTAPRKEYNRVDKFMRAIEKNILVVSTREPGSIARRSENGDSMVNGSVDEEASGTQPAQDVEMEYWEKDCPSTVTISVHTIENETPLLHTVMPTTTVVKNVFGNEETSQEKLDSTTSKDTAGSNFTSASEFSTTLAQPPQGHTPNLSVSPAMQNLSSIVSESAGIVGDVSEAIMNEDTSSQPSLDLENEETDSVDISRKLQTTFQSKDFPPSDDKSTKFYSDNNKLNQKAENDTMSSLSEVEIANATNDKESKAETNLETEKEPTDPPLVPEPKADDEKMQETAKSETEMETTQSTLDESEKVVADKCNNTETIRETSSENVQTKPFELYTMEKNEDQSTTNINPVSLPTESKVGIPQTQPTSEDDQPGDVLADKNLSMEAESSGESKPIVEEPTTKDEDIQENSNLNQDENGLVIAEATEEEKEEKVGNSLVPDPIPIVEEPKDAEPLNDKTEIASSIVEMPSESEIEGPATINDEVSMSIEGNDMRDLQESNKGPLDKEKDSEFSAMETKAESAPVEMMDVDEEEETLSILQQDEPMDQETTELLKS